MKEEMVIKIKEKWLHCPTIFDCRQLCFLYCHQEELEVAAVVVSYSGDAVGVLSPFRLLFLPPFALVELKSGHCRRVYSNVLILCSVAGIRH